MNFKINDGCMACLSRRTYVYKNGFKEMKCFHGSNVIILFRYDKDYFKFKKSCKRMNKNRTCKNFKKAEK